MLNETNPACRSGKIDLIQQWHAIHNGIEILLRAHSNHGQRKIVSASVTHGFILSTRFSYAIADHHPQWSNLSVHL